MALKSLLPLAAGLAAFTLASCQLHDAGAAPEGGGPRKPSATGQMCGGIAGLQCQVELFCDMPAGQCRTPDMAGVCRARPEICTMDYRPVCGCDGKTYGNACGAASAGVSIASQGECKGG